MSARKIPVMQRLVTGSRFESSGCLVWQRVKCRDGYGLIRMEKGNRGAHRVAYELLHGAVPSGLHLDHLCRRRDCINPLHLEVVTPKENARRGIEAQKTACKYGHAFTPANTHYVGDRRYCRACRARFGREYRQRRKAAQ